MFSRHINGGAEPQGKGKILCDCLNLFTSIYMMGIYHSALHFRVTYIQEKPLFLFLLNIFNCILGKPCYISCSHCCCQQSQPQGQ
uniref:TVP38/TMEM64 family membrane protein slr0305-like n=1 Tax=Rhizophora mucronata TaxID=61149 RepID=A0A2P2J446_RHIMU